MSDDFEVARREALKTIVGELHSVEGRMTQFNGRTLSIIQLILVLLGVGLFAANEVRELFVVVPLFWSVWMFYGLTVDRDTLKYEVYASHLEERANALLQEMAADESAQSTVFRYRTTLTSLSLSEPIYLASYAYWTVLNITSWVIAVVILHREGYEAPAIVLAAVGVLVWAVVVATVISRPSAKRSYEAAMGRVRSGGG